MMNNYVVELKNFPKNPFSHNYTHSEEEYELVPTNYLNIQIIEMLKKLNLSTNKFSIFRSFGFKEHNIHRDNNLYDDMAKIIWMWGDNHEMFWYEAVDNAKSISGSKTGPKLVSSSYMIYSKKDVRVIHKQKIIGPSIIQVGPPHSVVNYSGSRVSCTIVPFFSKNGVPIRPLKFTEAADIFSDFLI